MKVANKKEGEAIFKRSAQIHKVYHKFSNWAKSLWGENWQDDLVGFEKMELIEAYAKKNKQIKITYCDDDMFASSLIVIIPHKGMGNTIIFVPQLTTITNKLFLYPEHQKMLVEALNQPNQ